MVKLVATEVEQVEEAQESESVAAPMARADAEPALESEPGSGSVMEKKAAEAALVPEVE